MEKEVFLITDEDERRIGTVAQLLNPEGMEDFVDCIQVLRHAIAEMVFGPEDKETTHILVELR